MKKSLCSGCLLAVAMLFFVGCVRATAPGTAKAPSASGTFTENLSCGKAFSASGWAKGYTFAYEVLDKTSKGKGFKVKTLANAGGSMIHLECARNLPSRDAALAWLLDSGYGVGSDGAEEGGASGQHLTVDRGPLYKVPAHLYK